MKELSYVCGKPPLLKRDYQDLQPEDVILHKYKGYLPVAEVLTRYFSAVCKIKSISFSRATGSRHNCIKWSICCANHNFIIPWYCKKNSSVVSLRDHYCRVALKK